MSQTLQIRENYLVVFVCPRIYDEICYGMCPEICHEYVPLKKIIKKTMVS